LAHDNLEQLQELLRRQNPSGDLATIIERALRVLLEREKKQRFGHTSARKRAQAKDETAKPNTDEVNLSGTVSESSAHANASEAKSRYIPRKIRAEVFARDNGQCTFVSADGRRCQARGFLEVHHHEVTFARGGEATVENLRVTCRAHNSLWADRDYGRGFMQSKSREAAVRRSQARAVRSGA
jgi:hypothetical protein